MRANLVRFSPAARTNWHSHVVGQTLHVTSGIALIGTRDGTILETHPGQTVTCPPGEEHWHGATSDLFMEHIALWEATATAPPRPPGWNQCPHFVARAILCGHFDVATRANEEAAGIRAAIGVVPEPVGSVILAGWRGREQETLAVTRSARAVLVGYGSGQGLTILDYVTALQYNALGRYDVALDAVRGRIDPGVSCGCPVGAARGDRCRRPQQQPARCRQGDGAPCRRRGRRF